MVDITHKIITHRTAIAQAVVRVSSHSTIDAIQARKVPKGDVFAMAKAAGLLAAKRTSDIIPDCHPVPIEFTSVNYEIRGLEIYITVETRTIYKTGIEVEAMHAASIVALTIYDMLKPLDKNIYLEKIGIVEKTGGKSSSQGKKLIGLEAAVIVCSDSISNGEKADRAGKAIIQKLRECLVHIKHYIIIPDELPMIQEKVRDFCKEGLNMVLVTGGTGLSARDVTTEALKEIIEKPIPGIEEAIRAYGQQRTPYSMLSRSVAGLTDHTLVLGLPGSTRGATESMEAIFPSVLHIFRIMKNMGHD